jgi:cytochrome c oxidase assembly factor CtaG
MTSAFQWWCAATGMPWNWEWQWFPGVHLFLLAIAAGWWWLGKRHAWSRRPWGWFGLAWLALLATLDWPIGKLGAGYLASVHTVQFLLLTLVAGPALLRSIPADGWQRLAPPDSRFRALLMFQVRALPALILYNAIVITTHFPLVVDTMMSTQLGSALIDVSWLVAGLLLWWPLAAPRAFRRLGMFAKIGYLFGATIVPTIPAMMMVFSDWPMYQLYELAPRVWVSFSANEDVQLAGLVMKLFGDLPLWFAAAYVFFSESKEAESQGDTVPDSP